MQVNFAVEMSFKLLNGLAEFAGDLTKRGDDLIGSFRGGGLRFVAGSRGQRTHRQEGSGNPGSEHRMARSHDGTPQTHSATLRGRVLPSGFGAEEFEHNVSDSAAASATTRKSGKIGPDSGFRGSLSLSRQLN